MSQYVKCGSVMSDQECLIKALMRSGGWTREQIEVHTKPQTLHDWYGQPRPEKANIIIRRKNLCAASNDIGFVKNADGTFSSIISKFDGDYRWGQEWMTQTTNAYNEFKVIQTCEQMGYGYEVEEHEGVRHIVAYVYE